MVEKFITGLCYMGGGLLALTIVGLATWFACWVWIKTSSRFRGICKAESLIYEYKNNRDDFMYWKYMIKKGGEKAILAERDAAVAELERIQEFTETDFLNYLNNTIHPECGYSYYTALFDLLCEVTNWQYKEWQKED